MTLLEAQPLHTDFDRRVSTGNPQADQILHGGFPANSINLIMGQPGTGKTIFAEQMLFHNASPEQPVLFLTTLAEPFQKVVSYLQRFSFFDEAKFGSCVVYDDIGQDLIEGGFERLNARVRDAIRELQPSIIVVDSFKAVHDLIESPQEARRWIVNLAGELTASATTTFLIGEYTSDQVAHYPEFAIADGIIEFARKALSNRDERFVRVLKLRGSRYHEGLHGFRITPAGLEVFPRLIATSLEAASPLMERVSCGTGTVDELLDGGLWRGSSTLVIGAAGVGKTTLALQFILEGLRQGEPGIFLTFQETPLQLARVLRGMGHELDELRRRGAHVQYVSPVELHIDSIIAQLFETIRTAGIRRIAIDAIGDLISAATDLERFHDYLYAILQHLSAAGVTSMLTFESLGPDALTSSSGTRLSYMSDNIFLLTLDIDESEPLRSFRILKARATGHDLRAHSFTIASDGLQVKR